ncbi:DUF4132 domain-containing protein [Saccharomonospora cyanea]|uniref:DUF4132 domain-containing protein n=1 Tax=Saccharomonospora cyanea TaxID=40989 RepID=UPI001E563E9A|nr:DUF4132 domain-containing protein [Saccharomonospora cyanea]
MELVKGTSAKFWEGARDGCTVTVRWGRIGTGGQSNRREFGDESAAQSFLDKQIAEKVRKGYSESATEPQGAEPQDTEPRDETEESVPVPSGEHESVFDLDEDAFVPSPALTRGFLARRDRLVTERRPDPAAAGFLADHLERDAAKGGQAFRSPDTDPELRDAAHRYLAGEADPVGAAVHATTAHSWYRNSAKPGLFGAGWITHHGVVFAAEAAAALASISIRVEDNKPFLTRRDEDEALSWWWFGRPILTEVRVALAEATDVEYAAAVARIADHRASKAARAAAAYLVPTEAGWVDEALRDAVGTPPDYSTDEWMWTCAVSTVDQLRAIEHHLSPWNLERSPQSLATLVLTVGPDIAPFLAELVDSDGGADITRKLLSVLAELPTDEAFRLLVDRLDRKYVQPAVLKAMKRFPKRARRVLAHTKGGEPLLRALLLSNPDLADTTGLDPDTAAVVAAVAESAKRVPDAPVEALPPVLSSPPWKRPRRRTKPVVVELDASEETRLVWLDGERERWAALAIRHRYSRKETDWSARLEAVAEGSGHPFQDPDILLSAPTELVLPVLSRWRPRGLWSFGDWGRALLGKFGEAAVTPLVSAADRTAAESFAVLVPVLDARVADLMADGLARSKSVRPHARAWLSRHGAEGAALLVPRALGKAGRQRAAAEAAIRFVARSTGPGAILTATRRYGDEAVAGIEALLTRDPLEDLPASLPKVGDWADPGLLPQIRMRDGETALSIEATADVLTMLALSKPGEPYGGLDQVAEVAAPGALPAFVWGVFERWQAAGYPSKDGWVIPALGHLGDDDTVRALAPVIRAWPGEGGHQRAVAGLDALAAIGTDVALMHLNGIAQKVKFAGLKKKAGEKIAQVAADLGLSAEQLADRLVPDLGLDSDGSLVLDYGPRRFTVGFDEQLKPYVLDMDGTPRKNLPKPGAKDDPDIAPAAYKRFSALKKDARTLAADQLRRLEQAMVSQRRWSTAEFEELFVAHPLLWHVVRRLVWAVFDGGHTTGFRVAEDRTLADVDDETFTLPDDAVVGVPHPLHLGETLTAWAEVFADYEILQPFPQLGRPVHRLTEEERGKSRLTRFEGVEVAVGTLLGLLRRGWQRGEPQDAGVEPWMTKPLPDGRVVVLHLDPGIAVGALMELPDQRVDAVTLEPVKGYYWSGRNTDPFGTLDPVSECELMADLTEVLGR